MPTYEIVLLLQKLSRPALKEALKRSAQYIFDVNGVIRSIENLGPRNLPYSISQKGKKHRFANCFIYTYDAGVQDPLKITEKLKLDFDVVRSKTYIVANDPIELHSEKKVPECDIWIDFLPPLERPAVQKIQNFGKDREERNKSGGRNFDRADFRVV